ncbi:MAG: PilZ domain-containing protein [Novosphingobium sp.]
MASEPAFHTTGGRRIERRFWAADVQFRSGTRRANVKVRDISELGARIEGVFLVREGDSFFIKLPAMESIEARVVWVADFEFGCEFLRPLNPVILEAMVANQR